MPELSSAALAECVGRARDRYVRTHRQGSMATVCAMILFDALRSDIERSGRRQVTSVSRPELRDAMAAHPAWEGKAFEETSFNTIPEDLGEQLQQFVHEDFAEGATWRFRFAGPTRKFRKDQTTRELFLEYECEPAATHAETPRVETRRSTVWIAIAAVALIAAGALFLFLRRSQRPAREVIIAVVPFRLLTPDPRLDYLGTGIADAVITRVSNLEPVRVRPTTAVLRYAHTDRDPEAIGRELGVDYVVAGTMQETRISIRSTVQLVRSSDGAAVWGRQFDVAPADLLSLQDEIATRVASSLHLRLSDEHRATASRRETREPEAFEHYVRGRAALLQLTKDDTTLAIAEFDRALAIDPGYAAARAGLGSAAAQMRIRFSSKEDAAQWAARAKSEASRALQLAPDLAEAHEALAAVYRYDEFDWDRVMAESGRAIALNPDLELPHYYRGAAAFHLGLIDVAQREARIGMDLNRARPIEALRLLAISAVTLRKWPDAEQLLAEVTRRTDIADYYEALALFHLGRPADAEALLRQPGGGETRNARAGAALASILAASGRKDEARAVADRIGKGTVDHHVAYSLGAAYAQLGDRAKALDWLQRAIDSGFPSYPYFAGDPMLDPMRGDPSFVSMLAALERRHAAWARKYA